MPTFIDLTGRRFGRLTVLRLGEKRKKRHHWVCQCVCGVLCSVGGELLRDGRTRSCGCLNKEVLCARKGPLNPAFTHGVSGHPLWSVWNGMHQRCSDKNHIAFKNYGGRGITVCREWSAPKPFIRWAERTGWAPGLTLDRINNNRGYYPRNCRWASREEQAQNTRACYFVVYGGKRMSINKAARLAGIPPTTAHSRKRIGWPEEEWFTKRRA